MKKLCKLSYFLATGFGIGGIIPNTIPVGTVASLVAVPIWWVFIYFFSYRIYFIFLIFGTLIGIYCCEKINNSMDIHDHKSIVWDEFIGMWITLIVVPIYNWNWIVIAFMLFRILDIIKPWPISWVDRVVKGGIGIIMDDMLAGFLAMCIVISVMHMNIFF